MAKAIDSLAPITVARLQWKDRGYFWVAFHCHHMYVPEPIGLDSRFEKKYFEQEKNDLVYGLGNTPGAAMRQMYKRKRESDGK